MRLIKKLVNWFEDLLWTRAIKDVFENPEDYLDTEYYLDDEYKDGDSE